MLELPTPRTPDPRDAPVLRWGILGPGWIAHRFVEALRHYAFRLFLRGAIQHPEGFAPDDATRFLGGAPAPRMSAFAWS